MLVWSFWMAIIALFYHNDCTRPLLTDIDRLTRCQHHFFTSTGLTLGGFGFPSDSPGLYVMINMHEKSCMSRKSSAHMYTKIMGTFCLRLFQRARSARFEYPNWSSMADNAIIRTGIEGLLSPCYICALPWDDMPIWVYLTPKWLIPMVSIRVTAWHRIKGLHDVVRTYTCMTLPHSLVSLLYGSLWRKTTKPAVVFDLL